MVCPRHILDMMKGPEEGLWICSAQLQEVIYRCAPTLSVISIVAFSSLVHGVMRVV